MNKNISSTINYFTDDQSLMSNIQENKIKNTKKSTQTLIQTQNQKKNVESSCLRQESAEALKDCIVETKDIFLENGKKNSSAKKKLTPKNLKMDTDSKENKQGIVNIESESQDVGKDNSATDATMVENNHMIGDCNNNNVSGKEKKKEKDVAKNTLFTTYSSKSNVECSNDNISSKAHNLFDDDFTEQPVKKETEEQIDPIEEELITVLRNHHIIFSKEFVIENHLLWYGPSESNKKNLVRFFLSNYYNERNMRVEKHIFTISNHHDNLNVVIYKSQFHWEIDFRWTGNNTNNSTNKNSNDEYIIDYFNNHFCKTCNINLNTFKVLVFFNSHRLTYNNQKMILRIMENTFRNVKFIIITDQINKIDTTIKSRCINIRIPLLFDNIYYYINLNEYTHKFNFFKFDMKSCLQNNPNNLNQYICEAISTSKSKKYKPSNEAKISGDIKNTNTANVSEVANYKTQDNPMEIFFDQKINTALLNQGVWVGNSEKNFLKNLFDKISRLKASLDSIHFQEMYYSVIDDIDNYLLSCHTIQEFLKNFVIYLNESHQSYMSQKYGSILQNSPGTSCPEYDSESLKFLKSISVYLTKFAEVEYISQKCDYQIYSIESFLSFYLTE